MTVEFENVSAPALRWLARRRPVRPGWRTVWVSQNRLREKTLPRPPRASRSPPGGRSGPHDELAAAVAALGLPLILKTAASGYDGKGQVRVDDAGRRRGGVVEPGPGRLRGRGLGRRSRPRSRWSSPGARTAGP